MNENLPGNLPLTLAIITLNEEANIQRCIESVPFASEVIVVDSGSQDNTVQIAQSLGARVVHQPWLGFGKQKHLAAQEAKNDWVLSLDADEALSQELQFEIQNKLLQLDPLTAYQLPRVSYHLGRWIRHGGWYPDYQTRLFNKKHAQWNQDSIHEQVLAAKKEQLKYDLCHWVFKNKSHQVITNDRYSSLQAKDEFEKNKKFNILKLIFRPWGKFIENYFLKRGFLDGLPGFMIAVSSSYSMFLRYCKVWEIEQKEKKS